MSKGHPDWNIDTEASVVVSQDSGELSVRLGSEYRISRTGHIYYATTFRDDISVWRKTKVGSNTNIGVDTKGGCFGKGSLLLSAAAAVNANFTLVKRLPLVTSGKWGLEVIIWFDTNNVQFQASITIADGSNERVYGFEVNSADDDIKLLDSDATYDSVQSLTITPSSADDKWMYFKLVINEDTQSYDKLVINNDEITAITDSPDVNVNTDTPHVKITLYADNTANTTFKFRIGSCILTIDEP